MAAKHEIALNQVTLSITRESSAGRNDLLHYLAKTSSERWTNIEALLLREEEQLTSFEMRSGGSCSDGSEFMGKNYDEVSEYALVQAIINDESDKMYQLAKN